MSSISMKSLPKERLASLDILRGFDLFMLVFFQPVFVAFAHHWKDKPVISFLLNQLDHADWTGFAAWDLVMPLFLFMVGTAIPFSMEKYRVSSSKSVIYKKIAKRFIILFLLGAIVQGNMLSLDLLEIRIYTNTLQAIAVGYLFSAFFLLHLSLKGQLFATASLLIAYWALLTLFGDFTPSGNFSEFIDRAVLGKLRDGVWYQGGEWYFSNSYRYTWILSSMVFVVTTMFGVFAGQIIKQGNNKLKNSKILFAIGLVLLLSGWLLSFQTPIIKKIWSASMTLWSGGWCFLFMALFHYMIDYKGWSKGLNWLKIYGMNAITAYILGMVINFRSVGHSLLWGFEKYTGEYYAALITFINYLILFLILRMMYKLKVFVKI